MPTGGNAGTGGVAVPKGAVLRKEAALDCPADPGGDQFLIRFAKQ